MRHVLLAAVICTSTGAAWGEELPRRKPGLWDMQMERSQTRKPDRTPHRMSQCIDEKSDRELQRHAMQWAPGHSECSEPSLRKAGGQWLIDSVCKVNGGTVTTHSVVSGDFNADYKVESSTRFDPPVRAMKDSQTTLKLHWAGACPANMKPGDTEIDGRVINVLDLQNEQQAGPPARGQMTPEQMERMEKMMEQMKQRQGAGH